MHAYRMFFTVLVSCLSFIMVMLTVAGIGYAINEVSGAAGDSTWEPAIYLLTLVFFLIFMRRTTEMLGGVTKGLDKDEDEVDESRMIQELHHGLIRMDDRVESLETILMDKIKSNSGERAAHR